LYFLVISRSFRLRAVTVSQPVFWRFAR
jgi:hypothetical protein